MSYLRPDVLAVGCLQPSGFRFVKAKACKFSMCCENILSHTRPFPEKAGAKVC